nr:hypothetical protein GCM10025730_09450 [Promicromonospora thailandica]
MGLPEGGVRRVPGLRREEVAMLAGISADYYLRLERGRDRNPSPQVIAALARVLRLDETHVAHLRSLVEDAPRPPRPHHATLPPGALALLGSLAQPAYVEDRYFDVVAANDLARALSPTSTRGTTSSGTCSWTRRCRPCSPTGRTTRSASWRTCARRWVATSTTRA